MTFYVKLSEYNTKAVVMYFIINLIIKIMSLKSSGSRLIKLRLYRVKFFSALMNIQFEPLN